MTSKEKVIRSLEFDKPKQIPTQLWDLPWAENNYKAELLKIKKDFPDDIIHAPSLLKKPVKVTGNAYKKGEYIDEWGCTFENIQEGVIGEVKNPKIAVWTDVSNLRVPDELLTLKIDAVNSFCKANKDRFILSPVISRPFERLQFLRGTVNLYTDFYENPDEVNKLLKIIHDFFCKEFEQWAKTDIDGLWIMDDWGSQNSLLIDPAMWRSIFKPLYKEYAEIARKYHKYIFMHSDGNILSVYPDLIEIGINAVNSQMFCMGVENLKPYKGKITFWGEIDRQNILVNATVQEVEKAVKNVYQLLYADGGLIGQCEFGPGAKPENVYVVYKTWRSIEVK
jgi:uroporphyrinogen decarboxylase